MRRLLEVFKYLGLVLMGCMAPLTYGFVSWYFLFEEASVRDVGTWQWRLSVIFMCGCFTVAAAVILMFTFITKEREWLTFVATVMLITGMAAMIVPFLFLQFAF